MKHINVFENVLIVSGVAVSLSMIQNILGVIILSLQVVLILYKSGRKIYDHIKNKEYDKIENTLIDAKDQLEDLKNKDGKN
ncbi:MAG: hypothetical protein J6T10_27215 [Methanobrevibacter sp.]|nr:hypothetical protein [Methanobrevibacter sp.]